MKALDDVLPTTERTESPSQVQQKLNMLTRTILFKIVDLTPQTVVKEMLKCVCSTSVGDAPKLQ